MKKYRSFLFLVLLSAKATEAALPTFELKIEQHLFYPATLIIPANTKFKLLIRNLDNTPEEFESLTLNREKLVAGGGQTQLIMGPLPPGEYPFFGEFHSHLAQGVLLVK